MKKLFTLMFGLALAISAVTVTYAQDEPKQDQGKKKKGKKKSSDEPKKDLR
ncbi:MAG TPA: hypothetical protein VKV17_00450 [Bryobacteraceae bacterium]|nr:hypothetical protein [Bryobacteraceae bacterium]